MRGFVVFFVFINACFCMLWKNGIVYYSIHKLDYDIHSQDVITTTLAELQKEICIKFFQQPPGANQTAVDSKLLFISNPDKIKNCQPNTYDFSRKVILMPIGYKCLYDKSIARLMADMLRASIQQTDDSLDNFTDSRINSIDLIKKFREKDSDSAHPALLSPVDRNFINAHYHSECGALSQYVVPTAHRRADDSEPQGMQLSDENIKYYEDKLWPLGIVMYTIEEKLRDSIEHALLGHAITSIELMTCVTFQHVNDDKILTPKNLLWFGSDGEDTPLYGFQSGNQTIKLESMVYGARGHTAHVLNNLLRILGIHMMSNRFDRDNYININWNNVMRGKERLLDKTPQSAWLQHVPYDFASATHAPSNFACQSCELGGTTVQPNQDHLWQKTLSMGHTPELSESDVHTLKILYAKECGKRFGSNIL